MRHQTFSKTEFYIDKITKEKKPVMVAGCGGLVFVDRTYSSEFHTEVACIECGKRWMLDNEKNPLGKFLSRLERKFVNAGTN